MTSRHICNIHQVLSLIFKGGYSRIPIFDKNRSDIVGLILAKDLIFIDPEVCVCTDR